MKEKVQKNQIEASERRARQWVTLKGKEKAYKSAGDWINEVQGNLDWVLEELVGKLNFEIEGIERSDLNFKPSKQWIEEREKEWERLLKEAIEARLKKNKEHHLEWFKLLNERLTAALDAWDVDQIDREDIVSELFEEMGGDLIVGVQKIIRGGVEVGFEVGELEKQWMQGVLNIERFRKKLKTLGKSKSEDEILGGIQKYNKNIWFFKMRKKQWDEARTWKKNLEKELKEPFGIWAVDLEEEWVWLKNQEGGWEKWKEWMREDQREGKWSLHQNAIKSIKKQELSQWASMWLWVREVEEWPSGFEKGERQIMKGENKKRIRAAMDMEVFEWIGSEAVQEDGMLKMSWAEEWWRGEEKKSIREWREQWEKWEKQYKLEKKSKKRSGYDWGWGGDESLSERRLKEWERWRRGVDWGSERIEIQLRDWSKKIQNESKNKGKSNEEDCERIGAWMEILKDWEDLKDWIKEAWLERDWQEVGEEVIKRSQQWKEVQGQKEEQWNQMKEDVECWFRSKGWVIEPKKGNQRARRL